ncbi:mercury transporter MerT [Pseudomonas lalucatii]|uniref:Mercuric transport protein MerT n=1 Tax=Pseudomonas lalucatii TaxID=1424203 RepID=A0ABS5Q3U6_9PSED|nr:mercuric transporter MerT family protein [Pseudomonas lalucatii]MBS7663208.1 mercury transporter MerT [Pseudomonas lalucatii]QVM87136.1 mercury transporter MerT [Pseudomonas lalucatii]
MTALTGKASLVAAGLAAIGASLCCVAPLLLLTLGVGGAWVGSLTALEVYRPFFAALTLLFLGLAFHRLYIEPQACIPGKSCAAPRMRRQQRLVFWITTVLLLGLLALPWLAPLLY